MRNAANHLLSIVRQELLFYNKDGASAFRRFGASFQKLNYYTGAKWSLEAVLEFHEELGIAVVDGECAAVGLEEVVAYDGVQLVVEGVVGTEAIVNAAIGDIDIGETLQGKGVVK